MDKESIFELQKIDCNCNDCKFMVRDMATFNKWADFHRELQLLEFNKKKSLGHIRIDSVFQFDKSGLISYGHCSKINILISFIPNICQIETQGCFEHRRS
jgi:hypothetical protein